CTEKLERALAARPLVLDGAMGTELMAFGLPRGTPGELWNVDEPGWIRQVHRGYLDAGADLLVTNTFGGNRIALRARGVDPGRAAELSRAGAGLARAVAGDRALVLGDVGPSGVTPGQDVSEPKLSDAFEEQARALLEGGADFLLVESMYHPRELALAVGAARRAGAQRVFASVTLQPAGAGFGAFTGASLAELVGAALGAGADVVGANCGKDLSLDDWVRLTESLVTAAEGRPVLVEPSAGTPVAAPDGTLRWPVGHEAFAAVAPRLLAAGARLLGGCCGAGPAHVAALAAVVGALE
ncbi:MAG TPA: homocysteine S-methyltransferase family protein, partial [Anaeromyxobacter sp.]|nr:homocysteine S-methyltransferase family protein [Anaeromyxobacter sp.]